MIISCDNCGTTFRVFQKEIPDKIKSYKCSVCENQWEKDQINNVPNNTDSDLHEIKSVEEELQAIRTEVKKNTDKIEDISKEEINENSFDNQKTNKENTVYTIKKKSVAQIASEIAEASVKKSNNVNKTKKAVNKGLLVSKNDKIKKQDDPKSSTNYGYSIFFLIFMIAFSSSIYFRSMLVGYSYEYFPSYTEKYFPKLYQIFEKVKIPFNAELNKIEISNFGATYEKNFIKFFGNLKNKSSFPIITPSIKAIVVTEDGKILAETIIKIPKKYISSNKDLSFSYLFKTNKNFDNTTVRATILKEIHMNS